MRRRWRCGGRVDPWRWLLRPVLFRPTKGGEGRGWGPVLTPTPYLACSPQRVYGKLLIYLLRVCVLAPVGGIVPTSWGRHTQVLFLIEAPIKTRVANGKRIVLDGVQKALLPRRRKEGQKPLEHLLFGGAKVVPIPIEYRVQGHLQGRLAAQKVQAARRLKGHVLGTEFPRRLTNQWEKERGKERGMERKRARHRVEGGD